MRTPQELRRDNIKEIFKKRLKDGVIYLSPRKIIITESLNSDFTETEVFFEEEVSNQKNIHNLKETTAKGFVDGIFKILYKKYNNEYSSLRNIQLKDFAINPLLSSARRSLGTDAKTEVVITSEIKEHGLVDFSSTSRSIVYSTLNASLKIFEFYINCEKTFDILTMTLADAKRRTRFDIVENCIRDMSYLTSMNTYEKKKIQKGD